MITHSELMNRNWVEVYDENGDEVAIWVRGTASCQEKKKAEDRRRTLAAMFRHIAGRFFDKDQELAKQALKLAKEVMA